MTLVIFETCFLISETSQAEMHPRGKTMLVCESASTQRQESNGAQLRLPIQILKLATVMAAYNKLNRKQLPPPFHNRQVERKQRLIFVTFWKTTKHLLQLLKNTRPKETRL